MRDDLNSSKEIFEPKVDTSVPTNFGPWMQVPLGSNGKRLPPANPKNQYPSTFKKPLAVLDPVFLPLPRTKMTNLRHFLTIHVLNLRLIILIFRVNAR